MGAVKPLTHKKSITIFLTAILLPLILLTVCASASFINEWGEYQNDEANTGFMHDKIGHYTSELGITYTDGINGMNYQPLIINFTGDSDLETIIYSGNFLQIYNTQLNLIDEKNIGAIQGQPIIYNNGTSNIAVAISSDVIEAWYYNGTAFIDKFANDTQLNESFVCDTWIGLKCSGNTCHTACDNSTSTFVYSINMTAASWLVLETTINDARGVPAIADIDRDGRNEMAWLCDNDGNADYGLCVADLNNSLTPFMDAGFSGDGILDDIGPDGKMSNPVLWNVNGAGDTEILVSHKDSGSNRLAISTYKSDGTALWSADPQSFNAFEVLQTVMVDGEGTQFYACTSATTDAGGGVWQRYMICVDFEGTEISSGQTDFGEAAINGLPIVAADMNFDGLDELIFPDGIYYINNSLISNITGLTNYYIAIADVNGDAEPEVIATKAGITKIVYSSFTNSPPELNNTQNYGGYGSTLDYTTPICVGSTLTFLAQECDGITACNYDNDASTDTERIVSNCGQLASGSAGTSFTANLNNGTFAVSSPVFQCVYNVTGIFSVRLFLQDSFNDDGFTEYNTQTITVQVINGTAGITCNLGSAVSPGDTGGVAPSAQESQTN